jgi:SAM-dependent methyltransferase
MLWFLSQTVVPIYKKLRILGWVRFRILRQLYKLLWWNSPRNGEWDFILSWMEPLRVWQKPVHVLDVGSTESLLIYELLHRGYEVTGVDQRPYQEPNEHTEIKDLVYDDLSELKPVAYGTLGKKSTNGFDYIIACSTVEHIGLQAYGEDYKGVYEEDRDVMKKLHDLLDDDGFFILTVPNKHLGTDTGRGYTYGQFLHLTKGYKIIHYTERSNQICAVMIKS